MSAARANSGLVALILRETEKQTNKQTNKQDNVKQNMFRILFSPDTMKNSNV